METYKNAFDQHDDFMVWELHEIRHELHQDLSQKTLEEINIDAFKKYQSWQKDHGASLDVDEAAELEVLKDAA